MNTLTASDLIAGEEYILCRPIHGSAMIKEYVIRVEKFEVSKGVRFRIFRERCCLENETPTAWIDRPGIKIYLPFYVFSRSYFIPHSYIFADAVSNNY